MVKRHKIPDRWLDYKPIGECISGTKILAFKVPLRMALCQRNLQEREWFTPEMLIEQEPKLKTVIDLTNTSRYYNGQEEFGTKGIDHVKIMVEGRGTIPSNSQLERFFTAMDLHMEKYQDNDALIGVHCTHGLNRTGYFVCRWMVDRMKIHPNDAIARFNVARGHNIERHTLLNDLRNLPQICSDFYKRSNAFLPGRRDRYISPLDSSNYEEHHYSRQYERRRYAQNNWRSENRSRTARDIYKWRNNPRMSEREKINT